MKSAGKARNNGLYRHIRTSKEIIRNLLNDLYNNFVLSVDRLYYVDYECNDYSPEWDFEHWGAQYWKGK